MNARRTTDAQRHPARPNHDHGRRNFLGVAALTIAGAHVGAYGALTRSLGGPDNLGSIGRATGWLNSPRLAPSDLDGKVVLVDFWTYTCINWLRTLPYRRAWARKYGRSLVMIGVHTPEFSFERNVENVRRAVLGMGVEYAVAVDNDYAIWRAFNNRYWPALYLLDARGRVRHQQFGEGDYDGSERAIQRVLAESGTAGFDERLVAVEGQGVEAPADWSNLRSPENYLGSDRTEHFASPGGTASGRRRLYAAPPRLALNQWALAGEWTVGKEAAALNAPNGRLVCRFHARDLHLVMSGPAQGGPVRFRVTVDGRPPGPARGIDVDEGGNGVIVEPRMYQLVRQPLPIADRQFEIEFIDAGVETFAFTFG